MESPTVPDLFDVLDLIPDSRNRNELIELAELHGVEVDMMLRVAAELNRAVDYEAIATARCISVMLRLPMMVDS